MRKEKFNEAVTDIIYYQDINTGKVYQWTGKGYKELPQDQNSSNASDSSGSGQQISNKQGKNKQSKGNSQSKDKQQGGQSGSQSKGDKEKQQAGDKSGNANSSQGKNSSDIDNSSDGEFKNATTSDDSKDKGPQLGKAGNKEILDKEQAERDAKNSKDPDYVSNTQERLKRLKAKLDDPNLAKRLTKETSAIKDKEKYDREKRLADIARKKELRDKQFSSMQPVGTLEDFKLDLDDFIAREVLPSEDQDDWEMQSTYSRYNRRYGYLGDTAIIPGYEEIPPEKPTPIVAVYYDMSGSWDEKKIASGKKVIDKLREYEKDNLLILDENYFSNNVHSVEKSDDAKQHSKNDTTARNDARHEGGTAGQPILDDILKKHPDNVIILTDSDITDCVDYVAVSGSVWLLFKGGRSDNLCKHLRGETFTRYYDLEEK